MIVNNYACVLIKMPPNDPCHQMIPSKVKALRSYLGMVNGDCFFIVHRRLQFQLSSIFVSYTNLMSALFLFIGSLLFRVFCPTVFSFVTSSIFWVR